MFMHVDDDTGKTIGQYGQITIQGRKATFHTTCVDVIYNLENLPSWKAIGVRIQDVLELLAS